MCVFDDSSDALQEGSNILLGRFGEQFPVGIPAHILSEEIKAVLKPASRRRYNSATDDYCLARLSEKGTLTPSEMALPACVSVPLTYLT